jgi:CoA:oxalate CoA-transferase
MPPPEPQRVAGPFSGLLVVDLTHVLNGPFGTTILCDPMHRAQSTT